MHLYSYPMQLGKVVFDGMLSQFPSNEKANLHPKTPPRHFLPI
jgi:hypothetical protein